MESKSNIYLTPILVILISLYYGPVAATPRPPRYGQVHFVMVHGAGHGAWCWYKLIPVLKSQGHNVTAVDLAASGIDLQRPETLRSVAEYVEPLMGLMKSLCDGEKVILVAHSLGGLAISKAMEMFPDKVHMAIFVTALMPGPTFNFTSVSQGLVRWQAPQLDLKLVFGDGPDKPPTLSIGGPLFISLTMYDLSPKEVNNNLNESYKIGKYTTLVLKPCIISEGRGIGGVIGTATKVIHQRRDRSLVLTPKRYGSVNRIFVVSEKDKSLMKEFQLWMIKNNPPNHVENIQDSDHMVMISRPLDLGARLLYLAKKFA